MRFVCSGIQRKLQKIDHEYILSETGISEALKFLQSLLKEGTIQEGFFLYNYDFAEFLAVTETSDEKQHALNIKIAEFLNDNALGDYKEYQYHRQECIAHFFRITGGLDSSPLGEPQILEQVKECFTASLERDCTGPLLNHLFQQGLETGYRIRRETRISNGAVLLEEAIVELAEKIIDTVQAKTVLIAGHSPLARQIAALLIRKKIDRLLFSSASYEEDEALSLRYGGKPVPAERRLIELGESDLIVITTPFPEEIFNVNSIEHALRQRKHLPLILFDCQYPLSVSSEIKKIANVFYYEPEQLNSLITYNLSERKKEIPRAERIIRDENETYHQWLYSDQRYIFKDIVAKSRPMQKVLEMTNRIADTNITVLIQGETGTGKEIIARAIHQSSRRAKKNFIVVNCGAIPETLLESELFGHAKGSFTGAISNKVGLFQEAHGGTIFLDEIGDTTPPIQIKLLRVLQEREILPIGKTIPIKVDVRLIAATNQDLQKLVARGAFRQDLYFRLNVILLTLAPLRERSDDIIPLAQYFIKKFCSPIGKTVYELSRETERLLLRYTWPGNVRELENAMERAVALTLGFQITPTDLPLNIQQHTPPAVSSANVSTKPGTLRDLEREHIEAALKYYDWNYTIVAETLAIGRTTLWRKMKRYGIKPLVGTVPDESDDEDEIPSME